MKYLDSGSAAGSSKVQPKDAKARKMDHRFLRVSQVSTGLGISSLQPVEQYFRFLKVLQEFLGSEPTNKGNDSRKPERMGKLETKRNLERKRNLDDFYLQLT